MLTRFHPYYQSSGELHKADEWPMLLPQRPNIISPAWKELTYQCSPFPWTVPLTNTWKKAPGQLKISKRNTKSLGFIFRMSLGWGEDWCSVLLLANKVAFSEHATSAFTKAARKTVALLQTLLFVFFFLNYSPVGFWCFFVCSVLCLQFIYRKSMEPWRIRNNHSESNTDLIQYLIHSSPKHPSTFFYLST